jgi:hypothetical protein
MLSDSELNETLEDHIFFCSENDRYAVSSIRGKFASIEKFLVDNDRTTNKKKIDDGFGGGIGNDIIAKIKKRYENK